MVLVKVLRVTSITDPETGLPGRQIELVEHRQRQIAPRAYGGSGDMAFVQNIISQLQSTGLFPQVREITLPKIILYLKEDEYSMLGIDFDVNELYEITMKDGTISFKRVETESR
jgi:hypothetical protein